MNNVVTITVSHYNLAVFVCNSTFLLCHMTNKREYNKLHRTSLTSSLIALCHWLNHKPVAGSIDVFWQIIESFISISQQISSSPCTLPNKTKLKCSHTTEVFNDATWNAERSIKLVWQPTWHRWSCFSKDCINCLLF